MFCHPHFNYTTEKKIQGERKVPVHLCKNSATLLSGTRELCHMPLGSPSIPTPILRLPLRRIPLLSTRVQILFAHPVFKRHYLYV